MATGKEFIDKFKSLTDDDLRDLADSSSLSKGQSYYRNGNIYDAILRGMTLRADCSGSDDEPYVVMATLAPAGEADVKPLRDCLCSCPRGGFCKHIVALLLTWIHKPEEFEVRPEFTTQLESKSREELLALILRMLEREPDLEDLLELPVPVVSRESGAGRLQTVDVKTIRRQASKAFRINGYEWGAAGEIAGDLNQIVSLGDNYVTAGQWSNALVIYATVAEEAIEHYEETDDEGEIGSVVAACCRGLAVCLDAQAALEESDRLLPEMRAALLRTLYEVWKYDLLTMGGIDLSDDAEEAIARNATEPERRQVEEWLRKEMRSGEKHSDSFANKALVGFLVTLKEHSGISQEELLEEYRRFQLWTDATDLLLQLGRVDEASAVAQEHLHESYAVIQFAGKLLALGGERVTQGLAFVEARLQEVEGSAAPRETGNYQVWLEDQYAAQGMPEKSLAMARRRFEDRPGKTTYESVKHAARLPGIQEQRWSEIRPELIALLEAKNAWRDLASLYLDEGAVRHALDAIKETERKPDLGSYYGGHESNLWDRVAKAAETDFPEEAFGIYLRLADRQIEQRKREAYREAANYLVRAKEMCSKQGREAEWRDYLASLRASYKSLRALKEELDAVGLK